MYSLLFLFLFSLFFVLICGVPAGGGFAAGAATFALSIFLLTGGASALLSSSPSRGAGSVLLAAGLVLKTAVSAVCVLAAIFAGADMIFFSAGVFVSLVILCVFAAGNANHYSKGR